MSARRDKAKVVDEVWDDDRIASFMHRQAPAGHPSVDHFRLLCAYQGMRVGDFRRFLAMFVNAGGEVDARDARGRTLADILARHRHGAEFLEVLAAYGATPDTGSQEREG